MRREIELRISEVPSDWRKQLGLEELDEDERVRLSIKTVSGRTRRDIINKVLSTPTTENAGRPVHELVREGRDEREARFQRLQEEARAKRKPRRTKAT